MGIRGQSKNILIHINEQVLHLKRVGGEKPYARFKLMGLDSASIDVRCFGKASLADQNACLYEGAIISIKKGRLSKEYKNLSCGDDSIFTLEAHTGYPHPRTAFSLF